MRAVQNILGNKELGDSKMRPARLIVLLTMLLFARFPAASAAADGGTLRGQARELAAMTPAQFEAAADVKDDAVDTVATITTEHGWQLHQGLLGVVNEDNFFRVFIDKKTGNARFQVYHRVHYVDRRRASFETVNYETPDGPASAALTIIFHTRNDCRTAFGCPFDEVFGFDIDEALLRTLAAKYAPAQIAVWKYRLKGRSGAQRDSFFTAAEIAGILAAVDRYRANHGLTR